METKTGTRVRCDSCGSELIVVKAADPELTCCDRPVSPMSPDKPRGPA